jgi:hypothetical protein
MKEVYRAATGQMTTGTVSHADSLRVPAAEALGVAIAWVNRAKRGNNRQADGLRANALCSGWSRSMNHTTLDLERGETWGRADGQTTPALLDNSNEFKLKRQLRPKGDDV